MPPSMLAPPIPTCSAVQRPTTVAPFKIPTPPSQQARVGTVRPHSSSLHPSGTHGRRHHACSSVTARAALFIDACRCSQSSQSAVPPPRSLNDRHDACPRLDARMGSVPQNAAMAALAARGRAVERCLLPPKPMRERYCSVPSNGAVAPTRVGGIPHPPLKIPPRLRDLRSSPRFDAPRATCADVAVCTETVSRYPVPQSTDINLTRNCI